MAKKVVATLQKGAGKEFTKVVRSIKSETTGAYTFKEEMVPNAQVQEVLNRK
ncbi:MAG: DUF4295 domain-containing protein [Bacteroidales bacterium]|jgi:hypothetical protein|nr:DUF4295 domain-containing protein [Bacteroidales bacterium]MDR1761306.1 DUF4295 domain-containing protein [Bacteroidales bacterium]